MIYGPDGQVLFSEDELKCKGSGLVALAPNFAQRLLLLRLQLDEPMIVNSCCRSAARNRAVGGHPRSLHVYDESHWETGGCCAIDIGTRDAAYRARLIRLALDTGWSVGLHAAFVHLDRRSDYTGMPQAVFPY
ncbi:hypothetical protein J2T57_002636 [Natronocella acetinitrilica]|uniref:Peptidase M15A C-terminal domain-containing protein n=1 Tax=Natronocella acetinitrilica TaxID=414046 RepID=A0AAE3KC91_9GAMM|nr:D-Ala-D-Ala carboxypeptidase family metallohydrolase [Natronocella acetinitrilica]MCP1675486.1 hypothetical protein [Natronocella acetinitrilica]